MKRNWTGIQDMRAYIFGVVQVECHFRDALFHSIQAKSAAESRNRSNIENSTPWP